VKRHPYARGVLLTVVMLLVVAALLWFGGLGRIGDQVAHFQRVYLVWFVLLTVAYELVRGALWHGLIRCLEGGVTVKSEIFAFAAGEAVKFVPTGAYLQNYILRQSADADFGHSSAATTAIIVAEIVVSLLGVAVLGVGNWSLTLRIAIVVLGTGVILLVRRYLGSPHPMRMPDWAMRYKPLRWVAKEYTHFRTGAAVLTHPRILAFTLGLTALSLVLSGVALYVVLRGLGVTGISFSQAIAVNCFGLAFYVVLGSLEAADVGVLVGIGVSKSAAVSAVLLNRALGIGVTIIMAAVVMAVLRGEWHTLRRRDPSRSSEAPAASTSPDPVAIPCR
jgi:uncharacterized membrane protein YbhN (UPF0104 family)